MVDCTYDFDLCNIISDDGFVTDEWDYITLNDNLINTQSGYPYNSGKTGTVSSILY